MILPKEFYFVRHGQTDGSRDKRKQDHPDIPLNGKGREQARLIQPIVTSLPIKTICCSPLLRAKETCQIACANLSVPYREIEELGECSREVWQQMIRKMPVDSFMQRVLKGINRALSLEGPVLIVSHGGIHWSLCHLMGIEQHEVVDHCKVTRFSIDDGRWSAVINW